MKTAEEKAKELFPNVPIYSQHYVTNQIGRKAFLKGVEFAKEQTTDVDELEKAICIAKKDVEVCMMDYNNTDEPTSAYPIGEVGHNHSKSEVYNRGVLLGLEKAKKLLKSTPTQDKVRELYSWMDRYDINIQAYNGDFNIYVSRNDVDLKSIGGYKDLNEAVEIVLEWLNRVNSKKR